MAFLVEPGTGLTNSNAYLSVADFKAYHADRGNDLSAFATGDIEDAIVKTSDYLDRRFRRKFKGDTLIPQNAQRMQWPRVNAFYLDGTNILGVPREIEEATAEYGFIALSSALAPNPVTDTRNQIVVEEEKAVGPIKKRTKYAQGGGQFSFKEYPVIDAILRELIIAGNELRRA